MSNDLNSDTLKFASIEQAIADIQAGKFVIVADDEGRENEGDLICAAEKITPEMMNFMLGKARGMVCVALTNERAAELNLHPMVNENTDPNQTAYTISVDAGFEFGVTTGVSAADRAITVQRLATGNATALDFRRPGHMFPITAKKGGVFRRIGHTEAAIDLTRLAGLSSIGVMCEILNEDGTMARRDDLAAFAETHGLSFVTISQLIQYRLEHERSVTRQVSREIETRFGKFTAIAYKDSLDGCEHLALVKGPIENLATTIPYIRLQHEDVISDLMVKAEDEIHEVAQSMRLIQEQESGVLVYLRHQDDSVHGVVGALKTYQKSEGVIPNAYASKNDMREYGAGAQILSDLGITQFKMLTESKKKIVALRGYGLEVVDTISLSKDVDFSLPPKIDLPSSIAAFVDEDQEDETTEPKIPTFMPMEQVHTTEQLVTPIVEAETVIPEEAVQEAVQEVVQEPVLEPALEITPEDLTVETATEALPEPAIPTVPMLTIQPTATIHPHPAVQNNQQAKAEEKPQAEKIAEQPSEKPVDILPELKAEPRFTTMRMGGQVMSGQALFEG